MPVSRQAVDRVINVDGFAFVDPKEVPNLTQRYTESFMRRRLFAVEDELVVDIFKMYQETFNAISSYANQQADFFSLETIENTPLGVEWRRRVTDFVGIALRELSLSVAQLAYEKITLGYLASYYGKLWMLDSMTENDVVNLVRISGDDASAAVLSNSLLEDVSSQIIYDNLGREWREMYRNELDDVMLNIRRSITTGMGDGKTIRQLMNDVANTLGVNIDRRMTTSPNVRANFNRVQTLTRSYAINANNSASLALYQENKDIIGQVAFITAQDNRVCPICIGVAGESPWDVGSLEIKHPVTDTHLQCRCSLIPILRDETEGDERLTIVPDEQLPSSTFTEWLIGFGLERLLVDFTRDSSDIDSTRIEDDEDLDNEDPTT